MKRLVVCGEISPSGFVGSGLCLKGCRERSRAFYGRSRGRHQNSRSSSLGSNHCHRWISDCVHHSGPAFDTVIPIHGGCGGHERRAFSSSLSLSLCTSVSLHMCIVSHVDWSWLFIGCGGIHSDRSHPSQCTLRVFVPGDPIPQILNRLHIDSRLPVPIYTHTGKAVSPWPILEHLLDPGWLPHHV